MKKKLFILPLIALLALVCAGCATEINAQGDEEQTDIGQLQEVVFDATYDGQTVEVDAGNLLVITLESNATTGFKWELAEELNANMVALIQSEYLTAEEADEDELVVGSGGCEVWTFDALTAGQTTIDMAYSRPWEGGEKGVETFTLNVTIK